MPSLYRVRGVDVVTGKDVVAMIPADSLGDALDRLGERGIFAATIIADDGGGLYGEAVVLPAKGEDGGAEQHGRHHRGQPPAKRRTFAEAADDAEYGRIVRMSGHGRAA